MEEANALAHQHQLMLMQRQQQQQQLLMLQQLQRNTQQQQQEAISRSHSNIDVHLLPQQPFLHRSTNAQFFTPNLNNPNPNASSSHLRHLQLPNQLYDSPQGQQYHTPNQNNKPVIHDSKININSSSLNPPQQQQQQKTARVKPAELRMAYQDAWRVCHPDFKRPFSSIEDACERLLPYHVVADYEAEEDDKILDTGLTGQMSRCQQWDHNIAAKVTEFTATFEKQVHAFNIISRKRGIGEFRTEDKVMLEQFLLQEEKRAYLELRAEIISRQKMSQATTEGNLSMAMAHGQPTHAGSQIRRDMVFPSIRGSQVNSIPISQEMVEHVHESNYEEMNDGNDMEPSENFLNDEETD